VSQRLSFTLANIIMKLPLMLMLLIFPQLADVCANEGIIKAIKAGNWSNVSIRPFFLFSDHAVRSPHIGVRPPSSLGPKDRYTMYEYRMANTKGRRFPVNVTVREETSQSLKHERVKPLLEIIVRALRFPQAKGKQEIPIRVLRIQFTGGDTHKPRIVDCVPTSEKELSDIMTLLNKYSKELGPTQ